LPPSLKNNKGKEGVGKRGASPLSKISSPSPFKERGIKGVRLTKTKWGERKYD